MANGDDARWHQQPVPVGLVSSAISIVVAVLAVWRVLVTPMEANITELKDAMKTLHAEIQSHVMEQQVRWSTVPNVTSLGGRVDALDVQEKLTQRQIRIHSMLHGHEGIVRDMATSTQAIETEKIQRAGRDETLAQQGAELARRVVVLEQTNTWFMQTRVTIQAQIAKLEESQRLEKRCGP